MRKVNRYTIPETRGNVRTRQGAIKRIRQTYEANKDIIDQRIFEEAARLGGRPPADYYEAFKDNVLNNLHHSFGGDQMQDKVWKNGRYVVEKLRVNEAIEKTFNNAIMTPYADRARMNLLKGLKKTDPDGLRQLTKEMGRAIGYEDIDYAADTGEYMIKMPTGAIYYITQETEQGRYGFHIFDPDLD